MNWLKVRRWKKSFGAVKPDLKIHMKIFFKRSHWIWLFLLLLLIAAKSIFWPRTYPSVQRDVKINTCRWKLSTGSEIGYTCFPADSGTNNTYPVIYLNGGPGGSSSPKVMDLLKPLTHEGFDLYFYDQVGSGASGRLAHIREYTVERHINDLLAIIEEIGSAKVILIGQSWGAILATNFLAAHPEKVAQLILTSPGPLYPVDPVMFRTVAPDSLQLKKPMTTNQQASEAARNNRMKWAEWVATHWGKKIVPESEADNYASYLSAQTDRSTTCDSAVSFPARGGSGYYAGLMTFEDLLKHSDPRPKLKELTLPVLIMKGQCDNQPWGATFEYTQLFRNHQLVLIQGAGHFIHVEQPANFYQSIKTFLLQE